MEEIGEIRLGTFIEAKGSSGLGGKYDFVYLIN